MSFVRAWVALMTVLIAAMMLAACGSASKSRVSSSTSPSASGIFGIVVLSSAGGEFMTGSPSPLPAGFYDAGDAGWWSPARTLPVRVIAASGEQKDKVVAKVSTDRQGLFRVKLPPGRYVLRVRLGRTWLSLKDKAFTYKVSGKYVKIVRVRPGQFTRTIVEIWTPLV